MCRHTKIVIFFYPQVVDVESLLLFWLSRGCQEDCHSKLGKLGILTNFLFLLLHTNSETIFKSDNLLLILQTILKYKINYQVIQLYI